MLVTALEAREDKERGIEVGANAYVVKSSFEQSNLLEIIHRLGVTPRSDPRAARRGLRGHPRLPHLPARRGPGHRGRRAPPRTAQEAVELAARLRPDVILMDVHMPVLDGYEATRKIMERTPTPIVMATASSSQSETRGGFTALEAGALILLGKPPALWEDGHDEAAAELLRTLKLMSEVKVVRRCGRHGAAAPVGAASRARARRAWWRSARRPAARRRCRRSWPRCPARSAPRSCSSSTSPTASSTGSSEWLGTRTAMDVVRRRPRARSCGPARSTSPAAAVT